MKKRPKANSFFPQALLLVGFGALLGILYSAGQDQTGPVHAQDQGALASGPEGLAGGFVNKFSQEVRSIANFVRPAVVSITVEGSQKQQRYHDLFDGFPFFPSPRQRQKIQSMGSGFIADPKGYILTNYHVIADAEAVQVTLSNRAKYQAKIIGGDPRTDVAVLRISGKGFPSAVLGDSSTAQVGDFVLAIGSPFGLSGTVTSGIVSSLGREIPDYDMTGPEGRYTDFIQTDAAINPGNSGGPLVNDRGQVIGINTMIFTSRNSPQSAGVGFSVPINIARSVMMSLIKHGRVVRGHLGIEGGNFDPDRVKSPKLKRGTVGVLISRVVSDGPAEKAGLKKDDVIIRYDDKKISSMARLRSLVGSTEVGQRISVAFIREGKERNIVVKIGELTKNQRASRPELESGQTDKVFEEDLGFTGRTMTQNLAREYRLPRIQGVLVTEVRSGSQAEERGLERGVVIYEANDKPIENVEDLRGVLGELKSGDRIKLRFQGGRYKNQIVLIIGN